MGKFKMNTYMFFVNEKKRMNPEWRNKSNAELVDLCSPMWKMLSPEEKQVYEEMKREYDATGEQREQRKKGEVRAGGYDAHGRPLMDIKRRDEEMKEAEQKKVEKIHKMVTEAMLENKFENKTFFLMEVNVFCDEYIPAFAEKILPPHKQSKPETIPAEISICKYSLEDGVKDEEIKQYFIKPGKFPVGSSFTVKKKIMETHKIDSEQEDDFYLDYKPEGKGKDDDFYLRHKLDGNGKEDDFYLRHKPEGKGKDDDFYLRHKPDGKGKEDDFYLRHKPDGKFKEDDFYLRRKPDDKSKEDAAAKHYRSVLQNILKFLDPSMNIDHLGVESRSSKLVLFTMPGSVSRCEKSLLWLYQKLFPNVDVGKMPLEVLELPQLLHELALASVSIQLSKATADEGKGEMMKKVIPTSVAEDFLEKDTFKYVDGMSCDWHQKNDAAMDGCGGSDHCTTTAVRRWGFIMADHLCRKFNIKLVKGRHIPKDSDDNPPDTEADREWEALPGLAIRPPVAPKGRSTNTDIRYRAQETPSTPLCLPTAGRVLHSANTISDYLDDDVSTSDRSLDHYNGSIASGVNNNVGVSGDKKQVGASKEKVFKQNALMAGLLANQNN